MVKTKRASTTKGIRMNDFEYSILSKHLKNYGFTDLRDYIQQSIINDYLSVAVHRIKEMQKKSGI